MTGRRCFFYITILSALLAGLLACHLLRVNEETAKFFISSYEHVPDTSERHDEEMRKRFPDEPSLLLRQGEGFYFSLFKSHPERPWYLWQWAYHNHAMRELPAMEWSGQPLSQQEGKVQQKIAGLAAIVDTLVELDTENGYPVLLQAWLETKEGITTSRDDETRLPIAQVVDEEHTAKAVALLRQAIAKKRFTMYGRELGAEWLRILKPATYAESLTALGSV